MSINSNHSFPYAEHETVSSGVLVITNTLIPAVLILLVSFLLVPGRTVPHGTPKSLIWRRKLWEWHTGWLGLGLSLATAWFITNGMKNLCGKPRPDLLSRCQPDLANLQQYLVGGIANSSSNGQLVSGDICKNPDDGVLQDGFRSFPSGHSSSGAAGLVYLSLFLASKFAVTIPFLTPSGYANEASFSAFPSRISNRSGGDEYELAERKPDTSEANGSAPPAEARVAQHTNTVAAVRRQAAAPPLYLLALTLLPTFTAIFIAMSRWFDFRHHGFDIISGFLIGTITAWYSFRYYHLPISQGAGWAWGPRSHEKAFWAGIGSFSYATRKFRPGENGSMGVVRAGDEEEGYARGASGEATGSRDGNGASSGARLHA
jgi:membrane-associated phospholipid phosphatase